MYFIARLPDANAQDFMLRAEIMEFFSEHDVSSQVFSADVLFGEDAARAKRCGCYRGEASACAECARRSAVAVGASGSRTASPLLANEPASTPLLPLPLPLPIHPTPMTLDLDVKPQPMLAPVSTASLELTDHVKIDSQPLDDVSNHPESCQLFEALDGKAQIHTVPLPLVPVLDLSPPRATATVHTKTEPVSLSEQVNLECLEEMECEDPYDLPSTSTAHTATAQRPIYKVDNNYVNMCISAILAKDQEKRERRASASSLPLRLTDWQSRMVKKVKKRVRKPAVPSKALLLYRERKEMEMEQRQSALLEQSSQREQRERERLARRRRKKKGKEEKTEKCKMCGERVASAGRHSLIRHARSHTDLPKRYECDLCTTSNIYYSSMRSHFHSHHRTAGEWTMRTNWTEENITTFLSTGRQCFPSLSNYWDKVGKTIEKEKKLEKEPIVKVKIRRGRPRKHFPEQEEASM